MATEAVTRPVATDGALRICLLLLDKKESDLRETYKEYVKTKEERGETKDVLSFRRFVFFTTIRNTPVSFTANSRTRGREVFFFSARILLFWKDNGRNQP